MPTPRVAELRHIGLREVLILVADRLGRIDEFNFGRCSHRRVNCVREIGKGPRCPRAQIEQAADVRLVEQPHHDVDAIVDRYEVTHLAAIFIVRMMRAKQANGVAGGDLFVKLMGNTSHRSLVVLVGSEHIEELQPGPLRWCRLSFSTQPGNAAIEQVFAPAVQIERPEISQIGTTLSQPMPRMIDRLRDFENAKNTESSSHPQPFHVNISFFVAETREKAHKLMGRNWRDEDIVNTVPDATASSIGTSRHSFTSGVGGWATWSFQDALKYSIYDDPDGCVEQLRNLGKDLSGMAQCILEFNRRGRLTNEEVKESMQLFGEAVMPQLA